MGKTLLELLDTFQFDPTLNPNKEKKGMLKPNPESAFDTNIKQSKDWLNATPKLYGTDIVRIMSQGQVDTKKLKKAAVKGAAQLASKIPIVGGIVGGSISQLTNPKLPDDLIDGDKMISSLYSDLINGKIRNDKGALGNFLKDNASLKNLGENLKNVAVSAAISGVTKVASTGLDALINKKKFTLKKKEEKKSTALISDLNIDKFSNDKFPSTYAFQSGAKTGIATYQNQFLSRGLFGGKIEAGNELGKSQKDIHKIKLSNNPVEDGLKISEDNRLNSFYQRLYNAPLQVDGKNVAPSVADAIIDTKNKPQLNKSFNLWEASDGTNGNNRYNYSKINTTGNSVYIVNADNTIDINLSLSQKFGAEETNLIKIVKGKNDYTFDTNIKVGNSNTELSIKNGTNYTYSKTELDSSLIQTSEKSRFIIDKLKSGNDTELIEGSTGNVETEVIQTVGRSILSTPIDTKKEEEYKYPFKTIGKKDTVARWNTKDAKFSDNVKKITDNDTKFLNNALQTQTKTSKNINPYLIKKRAILKSNAEDGIVKVRIAGINFLSTITNLSDKSAASWDSVKPIGSGVNFYLFNVWERDISFDLKLYAENKEQLNQIWEKVNTLSLYTKGETTDGVKGVFGWIIELIIGDLISVQGFLSDITMNVDDATPWEITKGSQAPMICSISVSFKVVTNGEGNYSFYNKLK